MMSPVIFESRASRRVEAVAIDRQVRGKAHALVDQGDFGSH